MRFFLLLILLLSSSIVFPLFVHCQSSGKNASPLLKIGTQLWMVDNLDVSHLRNGDPIMQAKSMNEWHYADSAKISAWCYPNFDETNIKLGKLYNFFAVNNSIGLAPNGWDIPTNADWDILVDFLGDEITGGAKLQAVDKISNNKIVKMSGSFYNQCPGSVNFDGFWGVGQSYSWWSSTNENETNWVRGISKSGPCRRYLGTTWGGGYAVRCISTRSSVGNFEGYEERYQLLDSTYNLVKIGNQIWSERNLSAKFFNNGDTILFVSNAEDWQKANRQHKSAWCYFDDRPINGKNFGLMYNWYAINDPRGIAPIGWHVPSKNDWLELLHNLGDSTAGCDLKSNVTWYGNVTNKSGLSIFSAGGRNMYGFFHLGLGGSTAFWTSTEASNETAYDIFLGDDCKVSSGDTEKSHGYYLRCIKD